MSQNEQDSTPVILITGPTASGKSRLALALAERLDGVIINADSMQVYRELAILTARPTPQDLELAPHRLYGTLGGDDVCSAGRWRRLAIEEIEAARRRAQPALVAGGTGLYLQALEQGIAEIPEVPPAIREAARARHASLGGPAFHAELARRDPESAARLHPADSQRLIRAWEVVEATGRTLADWQARTGQQPPYRFLRLVLLPPRAALYADCDRRFLRMLDAGAVGEVEALLARGLDPRLPVMKAVGVAELAAYLRGQTDLVTATAKAQQATRRYAKRQYTWQRGRAAGAVVIDAQYSESLEAEIFAKICSFMLTA